MFGLILNELRMGEEKLSPMQQLQQLTIRPKPSQGKGNGPPHRRRHLKPATVATRKNWISQVLYWIAARGMLAYPRRGEG